MVKTQEPLIFYSLLSKARAVITLTFEGISKKKKKIVQVFLPSTAKGRKTRFNIIQQVRTVNEVRTYNSILSGFLSVVIKILNCTSVCGISFLKEKQR